MADTHIERESLLAREAMQTVLRAGDLRGTTIIHKLWIVGRNTAILLPHAHLIRARERHREDVCGQRIRFSVSAGVHDLASIA